MDEEAAAINVPPGRGQGLDWVTEAVFQTGGLSFTKLGSFVYFSVTMTFYIAVEFEANAHCADNGLSRCRIHYNLGGRVTSLRCSISYCPMRYRLSAYVSPPDGVLPYRLEKVEDAVHSHNHLIAPIRGMTDDQKAVVLLCIERGQSMPKKVSH